MKIGRNEPCHCGSGKKYKKCCLVKDQSAEAENAMRQYLEPLNDVIHESGFFDKDLKEDLNEVFEEAFEPDVFNDEIPEKVKNDPRLNKQINDDVPKISAEDEKLVDEWWDKYKKLRKPVLEREFLEKFMEAHPELVLHLGLHYEVLFELGSRYLKLGKIDDHIQFLMRIREEFPDTYIKSAGYYDSDIIEWLIAKNRTGEISRYFESFVKYPIDFVDQLFGLINLLLALDVTSNLIELIKKVFKPVCYSNEVMEGSKILTPLVTDIYSKYLSPDFTDDNLESVISNLREMSIDLNDYVYTQAYWRSEFEKIFRPYELWELAKPVTQKEIETLHTDMSMNFMRYLKDKTGISWVSSRYYSRLINEYLHSWHNDTKKRNNTLFDFSKDVMDFQTVKLSRGIAFYLNITKVISMFNAIYYFAEYLVECGNIDESQALTIQTDCTDLYADNSPGWQTVYLEAHAFKSFPLWG